MGHQSLSVTAPDDVQQFKHNLSLISSKSERQRREALLHLTSHLTTERQANPMGSGAILNKVLPLISDTSTAVRQQLIKLLRALPARDITPNAKRISMFVRAGITHLSTDIRNDALGVLEWLLDVAGTELVICPGGWVKTLRSLCAMMGWSLSANKDGWSATARGGIRGKDSQQYARQITVTAKFLQAGLQRDNEISREPQQVNEGIYRVARDSHVFDYLQLFDQNEDEDARSYLDPDDRRQVLSRRFLVSIQKGAEHARQEGGASGRAGTLLNGILRNGLDGFDLSSAVEDQDLRDLW